MVYQKALKSCVLILLLCNCASTKHTDDHQAQKRLIPSPPMVSNIDQDNLINKIMIFAKVINVKHDIYTLEIHKLVKRGRNTPLVSEKDTIVAQNQTKTNFTIGKVYHLTIETPPQQAFESNQSKIWRIRSINY